MLDIEDILATERMFDQNKLDVRTVTMGISLLSCVSDDEKTLCDKIYDTIDGSRTIKSCRPFTLLLILMTFPATVLLIHHRPRMPW